ncbi:uncharacterized protein LOC110708921 [Chenopodium quinoa]|uniref:uncharacterized protein LOC110708921 n=1 Tax=Chenopodium quinoa TaxID=63459 RepID=UPI000B76FDA4|nr:uncharacterized protein LOC110708921 [Chenopodium quinoa]
MKMVMICLVVSSMLLGSVLGRTPSQQPALTLKVAVVQTNIDDSNRKFFKSNAAMTVYKPRVQNGQWSSTRIKLLNGVDSIEAGWMVDPHMFTDDDAHLYARFIAGQRVCVNHQCDGFVQVSKDVPLGIVPEKYSEIDVANQVEWGGEIDDPGPTSPAPEMGCGRMAAYDTRYSTFFRKVTVDTDSSKNVEPQGTTKILNCPSLYHVLDEGYQGDYWGRLMYYGDYNLR